MQNKERFQQAGYWDPALPDFINGYALGQRLWLFDQTSPYYRRHLLLHEGVHALMHSLFGAAGPPWYAEAWPSCWQRTTGRTASSRFPISPAIRTRCNSAGGSSLSAPDLAAGRPLSVAEVFALTVGRICASRPMPGTGRLAALLDGNPRFRDRFRQAPDCSATATSTRGFANCLPKMETSLTGSGGCSWPTWTTATISNGRTLIFAPAGRWAPNRPR